MQQADVIIIGAGPGGYEIAAELAAKGDKVTLIERDLLGGTCLNRGCIPTKCLCASASTALTVKGAAEFGVEVEGFKFDFGRAAERMRSVIDGLRENVSSLLSGVTTVQGEARLGANRTVTVGDETYTAPTILLATGSRPAVPSIPGAELAMTSDDFLQLTELPQRVAIVGGGVIGLEFASILAAFDREVTVIEYCKEVLPPFDSEIAKRLRSLLSRRGIKFVTGAAVKEIRPGYEVVYEGKRGETIVEADAVLMAVGRRAVIPDGLEEAGVKLTPKGFIEVDEHFRTSAEGILAIGDVNGQCMLAHAASAQARVAFGADIDLTLVPSAVFTIPEAAMVGMTEEQAAAEEDLEYGTVKLPVASNGKARAMGEADGILKLVYNRATRQLLGCHAVGPHAADIIAEAAALMNNHTGLDEIATGIIHAHPTLSELLPAAAHAAK